MTPTPPVPTTAPARSVWTAVVAWAAFFVLWTLFILGYSEGNILPAVRSSLVATFLATSASVLIWRLSGRVPWPRWLGGKFVWVHTLATGLFAVYWTILSPVLEAALMGEWPGQISWITPLTGWRMLGGIWLYFVIAGLSYAIRNATRVQEEERRASRAEALAAESRLTALRSNIRPHFLFNALHSINVLMDTNPPRAQEANEQLADLLRYAVRQRDSEFVSLGEEWSFAMGYLDMQRIRFGDRLRVEESLPGDLKSIQVPVFSLQPLVENAVLHGVEPDPDGGFVQLRAILVGGHDERLRVEITNSTYGQAEQRADGHGTGLQTLSERLRVLYDGAASLELLTGMDREVRAILDIPVL